MIDNNIISSLGVGSGIDTKNLVKQLVELEGAASQQRIDRKREETEATISAYGALKSALSTLQDSLTALTDPEGLFSKSASYTETDAIVPEKLDTNVSTGVYSLEVLETAQAQSLSSASFSDPKDAVGKGTLTIRLGEWSDDLSAFTADPEKGTHTITIDDSNNSLEGLRDAINDADIGVQASIVNDGSGHRLLLTAPSGASNELEIAVAEDNASPTNADASGLSAFAFNQSAQQLTNGQAGRDAELKINGLTVTRSSNLIDDVVEGFSFSVVKKAPGEVVTVTVSDDKAYAEQTIRAFVEAYNAFYEEVRPLYTHGSTDEEGNPLDALANDSMAKTVLSQIKTTIASAVPGLSDEGLNALSAIGIRTTKDDTLYFAEDDEGNEYFAEAINENFEMVQELFTPTTSSSTSDITVNGYQDRTVPGDYEVAITQQPRKGYFTTDAVTAPLDTAGKDYSFSIKVNGVTSGTLALPADKVYSSMAEMAEELQAQINADTNLRETRSSVAVSYDGNGFVFTSNQYGSKAIVEFAATSADFGADFGTATGVSTAGVDVKGIIDGKAGFGVGNVLLPELNTDPSGLSLIIGENATGGTISYSRGFAGQLNALISQFETNDGAIGVRTETLEDRLESLDEDQKRHDRRMSAFQERMMQQFIAMENILNGLNSSGGFLENLVDTLPFTASKD